MLFPHSQDPNNKDMEGRSFVSEKAMHYSNVMVLDPVTRKPVRVGWVSACPGFPSHGTLHSCAALCALSCMRAVSHTTPLARRFRPSRRRGSASA